MITVGQITAVLLLSIVVASNSSELTSLEDLPPGEYYYEGSYSPQMKGNQYVLLRKSGKTVVGLEVRSRSRNPCFRGFADENRIVNATRVFPPYHPDSKWEFQQGEALNMNQYHRVDQAGTTSDRETLQTCLQVFWR
ncbi:MAG: hypothetical protein F6K28_49695 [Microcoleus sp. SIO2G3]|nr:hypothetical protein [Microcoleus sp. SIO2G3]